MVFLWRLEVSFVLTINLSFNNFIESQMKVVWIRGGRGGYFESVRYITVKRSP